MDTNRLISAKTRRLNTTIAKAETETVIDTQDKRTPVEQLEKPTTELTEKNSDELKNGGSLKEKFNLLKKVNN